MENLLPSGQWKEAKTWERLRKAEWDLDPEPAFMYSERSLNPSMVILVLTQLLFFLQSPDLSCCISAARLMGSFPDRADKQEAESSPKQMNERM